jgi:hypothetical protein
MAKKNGRRDHFRHMAGCNDRKARDIKRERDAQLSKAKLAFGPGGFPRNAVPSQPIGQRAGR